MLVIDTNLKFNYFCSHRAKGPLLSNLMHIVAYLEGVTTGYGTKVTFEVLRPGILFCIMYIMYNVGTYCTYIDDLKNSNEAILQDEYDIWSMR